MKSNILLEVKDLSIGFRNSETNTLENVVDNISFNIDSGEILGVVGESGSGKSMTALSMMGLLPKDAVTSGEIVFDGQELFQLDEESRRKLKGKEMSMIFQEPMTSLNPSMRIGRQVEEMLILHEPGLEKDKRKEKTMDALDKAGLSNSTSVYNKYPHELSGGMRQRAMIAMAMICRPMLLIADEPTTALDVTIQDTILKLIKDLNINYGVTVVLISHDLSVIQKICSRALVMEDGHIVEKGKVEDIFRNPQENYTKQLIKAMPIIDLKGKQEDINKNQDGFNGNQDGLDVNHKAIKNGNEGIILQVNNLNVSYREKRGPLSKESENHVVKDVSLYLNKGETLGVVGESGSGKSTLSKAIVGILEDYKGEIILPNIKPQMVFQDPYSSLNPAKKVHWILEEPLKLQTKLDKEQRKEKVMEILKEVDLDEKYGDYYLSELSGGQRQRVAIGTALIVNPEFIVLDEPVSALDVTVQHQIIELLKKLKEEHKLSYLFISHDLNVIYQICDRVCVMHKGEIVETALVKELFSRPRHDYTKKLLESVI